MIRLLHLADVHLGVSMAPFGDLAAERRADLLRAFRALPEAARREEVDAVVVAGDLFDSAEPGREARAVAAETFARLIEEGSPVFVVPGNHDSPTLHPHPYRDGLGGAHLFLGSELERKTVETGGGPLHVYGLAYDASRQPDPLPGYERVAETGAHVVLLHGSAEFAPHWRIGANNLELPLEVLAGLECDYIALGDYHGFRAPERFGGDVPIPACYPGSFAALNLGETGVRGYVIAEIEPGAAPRVTRRSSGVPELLDVGEIDLGGAADEDEVMSRIAERVESGALPVGRLVGVPDFPIDEEALSARFAERFGFASIENASTFFESHRLDEIEATDTVAGHVVRLARRRIERAPDAQNRETVERALRRALRALGVS